MKVKHQKARLAARRDDFNTKGAKLPGYKQPGSMNPHKSFPHGPKKKGTR